MGKLHSLWTAFAKFYERHGDLPNARVVFEKATEVRAQPVAGCYLQNCNTLATLQHDMTLIACPSCITLQLCGAWGLLRRQLLFYSCCSSR